MTSPANRLTQTEFDKLINPYGTADHVRLAQEAHRARTSEAKLEAQVEKLTAENAKLVRQAMVDGVRINSLRRQVRKAREERNMYRHNLVAQSEILDASAVILIEERNTAIAERDALQREFDAPDGPMARAIAATLYNRLEVQLRQAQAQVAVEIDRAERAEAAVAAMTAELSQEGGPFSKAVKEALGGHTKESAKSIKRGAHEALELLGMTRWIMGQDMKAWANSPEGLNHAKVCDAMDELRKVLEVKE